jgi:glycosyltransferase involved in cell wall biosynthesis
LTQHPRGERRAPAVWLDLTTTLRLGAGQANGTLRVETHYAEALSRLMGPKLRFCRYLKTRRRFVGVHGLPPPGKPRSFAGKGEKRKAGSLRALAHGGEQAFRKWRRGLSGKVFRWIDAFTGANAFPEARPGDVLLLLGETWGQHDFHLLRELRRSRGIRVAVLCQDLIPLKFPQLFESEAFVEGCRAFADFLAEDADLAIAISNSTRADIADAARDKGGPKGRLVTLRPGADFDMAVKPERPAEPADLAPGNFVLSVSTIQARKNFDLLYHLWRRFSEQGVAGLPKLVIVGRKGFGSGDLLWQIAHDPLVRGSIAVLHHASDSELSWLYRNCLWTLYPSFYEGWGLPVSESLAHGKFCLASDSSSLPEAGQGLARHLDPLDFRAWEEAIRELLLAPETVAAAETRIRSGYRPMTWSQSAEQLAVHLRELLAEPPASA